MREKKTKGGDIGLGPGEGREELNLLPTHPQTLTPIHSFPISSHVVLDCIRFRGWIDDLDLLLA